MAKTVDAGDRVEWGKERVDAAHYDWETHVFLAGYELRVMWIPPSESAHRHAAKAIGKSRDLPVKRVDRL